MKIDVIKLKQMILEEIKSLQEEIEPDEIWKKLTPDKKLLTFHGVDAESIWNRLDDEQKSLQIQKLVKPKAGTAPSAEADELGMGG